MLRHRRSPSLPWSHHLHPRFHFEIAKDVPCFLVHFRFGIIRIIDCRILQTKNTRIQKVKPKRDKQLGRGKGKVGEGGGSGGQKFNFSMKCQKYEFAQKVL